MVVVARDEAGVPSFTPAEILAVSKSVPSISIRSRTLLPIQIHAQKPGCSFGQTPNGDFIFEELCCKYAGLEL